MKFWVKWFFAKENGVFQEMCASDGVGYLDGRMSLHNMISECIRRAENRKINKPGGFQIHRSDRFSRENPLTKIIEV